ncbi:MAG: potassium transporter TrkA [Proteobacteria bacterium]|nr:MAG: potassium transporter TrkA [Pseudomonadota bacterium]
MPTIFFILMRRLRAPLILLIVLYAFSVLGFVLIPGQDDQGNVWHMSFFHAFYFVSYMGSTIGFGEVPYAFTDAQRMWTTLTIYATVIGWLYSIGSLLAVFQDPLFTKLRREYSFLRQVRGVISPFYLICGYGETGSTLVKALAEEGIKSIVIDCDETRINELGLAALPRRPLGLVADAASPRVLQGAGVNKSNCLGVVALTDSDQVNLMVALGVYALNPDLRLLARVESSEAQENIRSFGENTVINPFEAFAERLELALTRPSHYILSEWMNGVPYQRLQEPVFPRKGAWVLAGFGRFGRAVHRLMMADGIPVRVIDIKQEGLPERAVTGTGTEAKTLLEAGIDMAVGIIAGTDNDVSNLSILMTAREQNPSLFMVARQNQRENELIFDRAHFSMTMKHGDVIAHRIFTLLRTPLISDFINECNQQDKAWVNQLISRILGVIDQEVPYLWEIRITDKQAPALYQACVSKQKPRLEHLLMSPSDRTKTLQAIPLLLKRSGAIDLIPDPMRELQPNDRLLMCAVPHMSGLMKWATHNEVILKYLLSGQEVSGGWLWRCLRERKWFFPNANQVARER